MIIYPYLLLFILLLLQADYSWFVLLPLLSLPLAYEVIQLLYSLEISSKLNKVLVKTAQLQVIYSVLLSLGFLV